MEQEETPDMLVGRLREALHVSGYTLNRAMHDLHALTIGNLWCLVSPGYRSDEINRFLRDNVDLSGFNLKDTHPEVVATLKSWMPDASNRALAEVIGVSKDTVRLDLLDSGENSPLPQDAAAPSGAQEDDSGEFSPASEVVEEDEDLEDEEVEGDEEHKPEDINDAVEEEDDLPAFMCGEGWTMPDLKRAYVLFFGLPSELQPRVTDLLEQPGICIPDILSMLDHIRAMDEAQQAELMRLQRSPDAYERSCAITMALNRPPPPHPRVMLLYDVRRDLVALGRRVESAAARYADLPGAAQVAAWSVQLTALADEAERLVTQLQQDKEVAIA